MLKALRQELEPLEQFKRSDAFSIADCRSISVRELFGRAIDLSPKRFRRLSPVERGNVAGLPAVAFQWPKRFNSLYRQLTTCRRMVSLRHPLRLLKPSIAQHDRPIQLIASSVNSAQEALSELIASLAPSSVPEKYWQTLSDSLALVDYAVHVQRLAKYHLMGLLDARNVLSSRFYDCRTKQSELRASLTKAQEATKHWTKESWRPMRSNCGSIWAVCG